jgi:hypothetical protein
MPQATKTSRKRHFFDNRRKYMGLILLEALGALLLLVLIVWWTMFAGRNKGELPQTDRGGAENKDPP